MNKIILLFFLLLNIGSTSVFSQGFQIPDVLNTKTNNNIKEPSFDIKLQVEKIDIDQFDLAVSIEIGEGSYIVSPFSKDGIYGHFDISIEESNHLKPFDVLLEFPESVEEFDTIIEQNVRFVRVNTTYNQKLKVLSKNDFEVTGTIWFLYEPSCIPYVVEFVMSNQSGTMEVKKTKTYISKEYKL